MVATLQPPQNRRRRFSVDGLKMLVEPRGIEPVTFALRTRRSPSAATAPITRSLDASAPGGAATASATALCQGRCSRCALIAPLRLRTLVAEHTCALRLIGRRGFARCTRCSTSSTRSSPIYIWLLIIQAVLSWLVAFNIVNRHNRAVAHGRRFSVAGYLSRRRCRFAASCPILGGIDISPVILILLLWFLDNLMFEYLG